MVHCGKIIGKLIHMENDKRLNAIEEQITRLLEQVVSGTQDHARLQLHVRTLESVVASLASELAAREGISEERILSRFQSLSDWYRDAWLGKASDIAPNPAAQLDDRSIDQIPTAAHPPRLFDPPESGEPG